MMGNINIAITKSRKKRIDIIVFCIVCIHLELTKLVRNVGRISEEESMDKKIDKEHILIQEQDGYFHLS